MNRGHVHARPAADSGKPGSPQQALRLDSQLCFALYSASLAMSRLYRPLLAPLKLTYPQYLVMLVLWERDAQRVRDLGERLQLDSGTLTPLLKRLESLGYVERRRGAQDEREVFVHLTARGRALKRDAHRLPQTVAAATGCSPTELQGLVTQVRDLRGRLLGAAADDEAPLLP
jgi:DNA-binding MarR family transcriptional regulator